MYPPTAPPTMYQQPPAYPQPPPVQMPYQQAPLGNVNQEGWMPLPMRGAPMYPPTAPPPMYQQPPAYPQPPPPQMPYQPASPGNVNQEGWMPLPQNYGAGVLTTANSPPGLEYLCGIDQLLVHQKVELLEALVGFESANKYTIKNSMGQKVYWAVEKNDCCTLNCCGPLRPFEMNIMDSTQREVLHISRPLRCDSCWFPCFLQQLEVMAPPGNTIGYVVQEWSILEPKFRIENAAGDCVLRIKGPLCTYSICGSDVEFQVLTPDGSNQVGAIRKQWSGVIREALTDADHFGITFPMDLDIGIKGVLLGACFLIDFMFFEKAGNRESDRIGMF